jgi:hypothetical protein
MSIEKARLYEILTAVETSEAVERIRAEAAACRSLVITPASVNLPEEQSDDLAFVRVDDEEFRRIFGVSRIDYSPLGELAAHIKPIVLVYTGE